MKAGSNASSQDISAQQLASEQGDSGEAQQRRRKKLPFWRMMLSVMQASFGVQKDSVRERDFEQGSIGGFVAAALIFTALFIASLVTVVKLVLP